MARMKTTIYLEPELLSATKALAVSSGRREYEIVEDALRAYMRSEEAATARRELRELLDRVAERSQLSDEEAMEIAVSAVHASRRKRRATGSSRARRP
jgi:hypothetical protein